MNTNEALTNSASLAPWKRGAVPAHWPDFAADREAPPVLASLVELESDAYSSPARGEPSDDAETRPVMRVSDIDVAETRPVTRMSDEVEGVAAGGGTRESETHGVILVEEHELEPTAPVEPRSRSHRDEIAAAIASELIGDKRLALDAVKFDDLEDDDELDELDDDDLLDDESTDASPPVDYIPALADRTRGTFTRVASKVLVPFAAIAILVIAMGGTWSTAGATPSGAVAPAPARTATTATDEADHPRSKSSHKDLSGKLNLNTASEDQLMLLPTVGPSKADRIVAWRKKNGGFKRPADLRRVKGFGYRTFKKLEPFLDVKGDTTLVAK